MAPLRKQLRRRPAEDEAAEPAAPPPPKPKPAATTTALSFDLDDEGEHFKIKKKKNRAKLAAPEDASRVAGENSLFPTSGVYTSEMLARLRASSVKPSLNSENSHNVDFEGSVGAETGTLPDAETIRAARAQRERARRAADEGANGLSAPADLGGFIPLNGRADFAMATDESAGQEDGHDAYSHSRLVREEADEEEDPIFADEAGPRIAFGVPVAKRQQPKARARNEAHFNTIELEAEDVHDHSERDDKAGQAGGSTSNGVHLEQRPSEGQGSMEAIAALGKELVSMQNEATWEKLHAELVRLEETMASQALEEGETLRLLEESATSCGEAEEALQREQREFDFLQRAQAYTEDLLDCLNEKISTIDKLESELCDVLEAHAQHARELEELRLSATGTRAQAALPEYHYWRPKPVRKRGSTTETLPANGDNDSSAAAMAALEAYEEGRSRRRRLRGRGGFSDEVGGDIHAGWSSDEELPARLEQQRRAVSAKAEALFADAAPEFCEVEHVRRRFAEWRAAHEASYRDSYIDMCLPTLLAPLVRIQLLRWEPLENGSIEEQPWYRELSAQSNATSDDDGSQAEAECHLLAQLVCKVAIPRIKHAVMFTWQVHSRKQGSQLIQGIQEVSNAVDFLSRRAAKLASQGKEDQEETEAAKAADEALRQLLMRVAARLEGAIEDVNIPPIVPITNAGRLGERASEAATWSMWRAIKLLAIVSSWCTLLSVEALQDLASVLLVHEIIPYLRAQLSSSEPRWKLIADALLRTAEVLPSAWRKASDCSGLAWSTPLRNFLVNEVVGKFSRAFVAPPFPDEIAGVGKAVVQTLVLLHEGEEGEKLRVSLMI